MRYGKTLSGYARALAVVFVSSTKTRSRHTSLPAWDNYSSQLLAPVQSCFSKLLAAGTLRIIRIQNRSLASSAPHRARYFSQMLWQRQG